jgi:hypothetical protein
MNDMHDNERPKQPGETAPMTRWPHQGRQETIKSKRWETTNER